MTVTPGEKTQGEVEGAGTAKELEGFDRIFPLIGGHHRYQWLLLAIISLAGTNAFNHLGYTFLGATPDHWCKVDALALTESVANWTDQQIRNISIPRYKTLKGDERYDQCSYYDLDYAQLVQSEPDDFEQAFARVDFSQVETKSCSDWVFDTSIYQSTVVTQFKLVCGRKHLAAAIQGTYMFGGFVGSLLQGTLSDLILGRRGIMLISSVLILIGGFGAWIAWSFISFVLFRFLIAMGASGLFQNKLTILMEYADPSSRAMFGFLAWTPYCVYYSLMALYGYLLRDWRNLQLSFCSSTLVVLSFFWIMPESSRWLASKDRDDEAIKILEGIAKTNRRPPPPREKLAAILQSCKEKKGDQCEGGPSEASLIRRVFTGFKNLAGNYVNLVRTPELRKRSLILWFLFISVTLVYYGIVFASPTLSNDPFLIVLLGGLVEFPGYIGAIPLAKWGRKPATALSFLVAGIACAAVSFVPNDIVWLRVLFSMVGKMFITGTFSILYVLAAELYPTTERATAVAAAALIGRFGSISAPYIALMKSTYSDLPTVVFAVAAILAGLVALLLPETKNSEMLEHVNAVEKAAVAAATAARTRSASQDQDEIRNDSMKLNDVHNNLA